MCVEPEQAKRRISFDIRHHGNTKVAERASDLNYLPIRPGVLPFRQNPRAWTGPDILINVDGNTVVVQLERGTGFFVHHA